MDYEREPMRAYAARPVTLAERELSEFRCASAARPANWTRLPSRSGFGQKVAGSLFSRV